MHDSSLTSRVIAGAAAGAAATLVLQPLRSATAKRFPESQPPIRKEPGQFMIEQAKSRLPESATEAIPHKVESVAAKSLALGYGMTFGALYGALRPRPAALLAEGAALGVATWAVGFLGWLPAVGLMPPVTKQTKAQTLTPIAQHLVFGLAAVLSLAAIGAARDALRGGATPTR